MQKLKLRLSELAEGRTLTDIANRSGLCKSAVSKLFNAERYLHPRFGTIVAVADAVGLAPDEAFELARKEHDT